MRVRLGAYCLFGAITTVLGSAGCAGGRTASPPMPAQTPSVTASAPTALAAAAPSSCAALLSETPGPTVNATTDSLRDTARARSDTVSASVGGAQAGDPDIILTAAIQADEVTFASQPRVRVRFCWAGDTLRVVQRQNIPSPVVAGTTYRNVFVAVELLGRLNAECLVDRISTARAPATRARADSAAGLGACAFLGAAAATGSQPSRPPPP